MEDELQYIFSLVNQWLKFAEKKCAVLLAANSGALTALLKVKIAEKQTVLNLIGPYGLAALALIVVSTFFCLISFFPRLKNLINFSSEGNKNLTYFGDLAHTKDKELLKNLNNQGNENNNGFTKIEIDLANQIISNSKIALRKYRLFRCSLIFSFISLLLISIRLGVYYV